MVSTLEGNTYGYANIIAGWILLTLGGVFLGLRLWSRRIKKRGLQLNDWFAIITLILNIVLVSHTTQAVVELGLGQPADKIGPQKSRALLKALVGIKPEWAFANAFVKLSILHLYVKVFVKRWLKIASWIMMGLSVLYSLSAFLEVFLLCSPMAYLWEPELHPDGRCINLAHAWLAVGFANLLIDALIIIIPLPVVWGLQTDKKRKIALTAIFSLGGIIIIVSGIRLETIRNFDPAHASYTLCPVVFWSSLEPLLGLINCCLPVIQPALHRLKGKRQLSISSRNSSAIELSSFNNSSARAGPANRTSYTAEAHHEEPYGTENVPPPDGILVRREFNVHWEDA